MVFGASAGRGPGLPGLDALPPAAPGAAEEPQVGQQAAPGMFPCLWFRTWVGMVVLVDTSHDLPLLTHPLIPLAISRPLSFAQLYSSFIERYSQSVEGNLARFQTSFTAPETLSRYEAPFSSVFAAAFGSVVRGARYGGPQLLIPFSVFTPLCSRVTGNKKLLAKLEKRRKREAKKLKKAAKRGAHAEEIARANLVEKRATLHSDLSDQWRNIRYPLFGLRLDLRGIALSSRFSPPPH